ncbi:hypothetical protein CTI12_AA536890 [Artemisia annua]|uniref:Uncharacterized protein n=1 Tax=Artemisia annua TaxID=35608 RepID=A0A2U1KXP9_ARTAN|nr:hypothetical protein CTI12_AA536890 [Artemisia annua]
MKVCSSSLNSTVFVVAGTNVESRSLPTFPASNSCRGLSVGPSDTLHKNNTVSVLSCAVYMLCSAGPNRLLQVLILWCRAPTVLLGTANYSNAVGSQEDRWSRSLFSLKRRTAKRQLTCKQGNSAMVSLMLSEKYDMDVYFWKDVLSIVNSDELHTVQVKGGISWGDMAFQPVIMTLITSELSRTNYCVTGADSIGSAYARMMVYIKRNQISANHIVLLFAFCNKDFPNRFRNIFSFISIESIIPTQEVVVGRANSSKNQFV